MVIHFQNHYRCPQQQWNFQQNSPRVATTAVDLSTGLLTTAMNLSTDLVKTINANTMLMTSTEVSPVSDDMDQSGGIQKITTIVTGVCGGIIEILIIVILCICAACIIKYILHCDGQKKRDSKTP